MFALKSLCLLLTISVVCAKTQNGPNRLKAQWKLNYWQKSTQHFCVQAFFLALYIFFPTTKLFARSLTYTSEFRCFSHCWFSRLEGNIDFRREHHQMIVDKTSLCCPHTTLHRFLDRRLSRSRYVVLRKFILLADKSWNCAIFFCVSTSPPWSHVSGQVALNRVIDLVGSSYTKQDWSDEFRFSCVRALIISIKSETLKSAIPGHIPHSG